ncbi:MAG: GIY-YIG nuclease family protein [Gammaproteobacteria bacterium]|nr:GIY-YIG nuclease family protein [Gammaproteobacteria bacterium]
MVWFVYIVRCVDATLYTGITRDIQRRLHEHNGDDRRGARYTRGRRPVELVYNESYISRSLASRREAAIKKLPRIRKEALIRQRPQAADRQNPQPPGTE